MGQLTQVLREINPERDERLLVGPQTVDDAGVVAIEGLPDLALVQTVDFFPPVLDDPYLYGAVAAANSLSDVYAMGGQPLSALNLAGFPTEFSQEWVREIFRGGFDKIREAGAVIAGGHTVVSAEPLFGFAVTGTVARDKVTSNAGAKPGDHLYLTKPLGMGSITTAGKKQRISPEEVAAAALVMATLNGAAAEAMVAAGVTTCTDITGFGLVGHGHNIAQGSDVALEFSLQALPIFRGARALASDGVVSGGSARGKASLGEDVHVAPGSDEAVVDIVFDAETSGGLLMAVQEENVSALEEELAARDVPIHRVGQVLDRGDHSIVLS